jgi:hypothetical protein
MKATQLLFFALAVLGLQGCPLDDDEPDAILTLNNSSDKSIVFYKEYKQPADTSIATIAFSLTGENTVERTVASNSFAEIPGPYKSLFQQLPDRVLMLYIFSKDTINQVPWQEIVDRNLLLRRFELTEQDLDRLDWQIEYP